MTKDATVTSALEVTFSAKCYIQIHDLLTYYIQMDTETSNMKINVCGTI